VTLNQPITVGAIILNYTFTNNNQEYTISGANPLTFESAGTATLTRTQGRGDFISAPVILNSNLEISQPETVGSANLTISGAISGDGGITRSGGTAGLDGITGLRVVLSNGSNSYSGDTVISGGRLRPGTLTAIPFGVGKGNVSIVGNGGNTSALELSPAGTYNFNGLSGDSDGYVVHGASNGTVQTLAVGNNDADGFDFGGTIQIESFLTPGTRKLNFEKVGAGTQTLSGANTYNGTTVVTGGTLLVTGSHLPADIGNPDTLLGGYTVAAGATLGGTGTIEAPVDLSGTISPGVAVGTLTIGDLTQQDGATTFFQLNPTDTTPGSGINDLLNIAGDLVGLEGTTVNISVSDYVNNGALAAEGTWILALYDDLAGTGLPTFNVLGVAPGYNYSVIPTSLGGPGAIQLTLTAVPEPGSLSLVIMGVTGVGMIVRRKRR
jgi:autotransporter-associated beta strand protein